LKLLRGKRTRLEKTRRLFFHLCGVHSPLCFNGLRDLLLHFLLFFSLPFSLLPPRQKGRNEGGFGRVDRGGKGGFFWQLGSRERAFGVGLQTRQHQFAGLCAERSHLRFARAWYKTGGAATRFVFLPCFGRGRKAWALLTHLIFFFMLPCPGLRSSFFFLKHLGDSSPFGDFAFLLQSSFVHDRCLFLCPSWGEGVSGECGKRRVGFHAGRVNPEDTLFFFCAWSALDA